MLEKPVFRKKFSIPIYHVNLYVYVCKDIPAVRNSKPVLKLFKNPCTGSDYIALASSEEYNFGVFFTLGSVNTTNVAHEIFHTTHRILDRAGVSFDTNNQEAGAMLNGYLMSLVIPHLL